MSTLEGRWAVVTGASSGLGADLARVLAERRCNTVLVARREERLKELARELEQGAGVRTDVVALDLCDAGAPEALFQRLAGEGISVDVLVNNAGFGVYGDDLGIPWERERQMLELDVSALVQLTKLFLPGMVERDFGHVLQVASIGAYQPTPSYAAYSAAKAFVLSYGEALSYELRRTRVRITVLSPGVTKTEFLQVSGQTPNLYQRMAMMPSRKVAEVGVRAMLRGRPSVVPGLLNKASVFGVRFMPRRAQAATAHLLMNLG
jgi:short-subunit dehydrogenase